MTYFQRQFNETKDPYWLLFCFTTHHQAGLAIPKWALDILCDAFQKHIEAGDSVDRALRLTKRGRKYDRSKDQRNGLIFSFIHLLQKAYGMSVKDACVTIIDGFFKGRFPKDWAPISLEHLENEYSASQYANTGTHIVYGDIMETAEPLLRHAPDSIKRKYMKKSRSS